MDTESTNRKGDQARTASRMFDAIEYLTSVANTAGLENVVRRLRAVQLELNETLKRVRDETRRKMNIH